MPHRLPARALAARAISSSFSFSSLSRPAARDRPQLRRYPYLTDLVGPHATINWATDTSTTSATLKYGTPSSCTANTVSATRTTITVGAMSGRTYKVTFDDVAFDTKQFGLAPI